MVFLAWAAQHINFRQLLAKRLDEASSDVVVVPVFNETGIQASTVAAAGAAGGHCYGNASTMYNCGPWAAVDLPPGWRGGRQPGASVGHSDRSVSSSSVTR